MDLEVAAHRIKADSAICACFWKIRCCEEGSEEGMKTMAVRATYCLEKTPEGWKIWHVHGSV